MDAHGRFLNADHTSPVDLHADPRPFHLAGTGASPQLGRQLIHLCKPRAAHGVSPRNKASAHIRRQLAVQRRRPGRTVFAGLLRGTEPGLGRLEDLADGRGVVNFENVNVLGQYLSSLEEGHFQVNAHVKNVRFIPPADGSPVICYTMEPATLANPPVKVDFDATKSFGQGAEIVSYAWSFGDGEAASGAIASHTYTKAGSYTVELAIQDALSRSARIMRLITILPYYDAVNLSNAVAGLNYKYAEGDFNFGSNFDAITSLAGGVTAGISLPERMRQGYYVVVYEGLIEVPVDGVYRFFVGMEFATGYEMLAGGAIYVHDRLLSSNNSGWGQIGLKAGLHPVRAILFKKSNAKQVEFKYMGPGIAAQEIPAEVFYH